MPAPGFAYGAFRPKKGRASDALPATTTAAEADATAQELIRRAGGRAAVIMGMPMWICPCPACRSANTLQIMVVQDKQGDSRTIATCSSCGANETTILAMPEEETLAP